MSEENVKMCDLCRKIDGVEEYRLQRIHPDGATNIVAHGDLCPAHAKRAVDFFKKGLRNPSDKPRPADVEATDKP